MAEAELDTDNLRADMLGTEAGMHVRLRLQAIMFTGSCIDAAYETRQDVYPQGVQLVLGSSTHAHLQDTLVMANLGYFQLKAQPGVLPLRWVPDQLLWCRLCVCCAAAERHR